MLQGGFARVHQTPLAAMPGRTGELSVTSRWGPVETQFDQVICLWPLQEMSSRDGGLTGFRNFAAFVATLAWSGPRVRDLG